MTDFIIRTLKFDLSAFIENSKYMLVGMVSIFIVIGAIIISTIVLNKIFQNKKDK